MGQALYQVSGDKAVKRAGSLLSRSWKKAQKQGLTLTEDCPTFQWNSIMWELKRVQEV